MPKGSQNDAKMDAKIMILFKFFAKGWFCWIVHHYRTRARLWGFRRPKNQKKIEEKRCRNDAWKRWCKNNEKWCQHGAKMKPKWHQKSIKNRCKIDAGKRYAKMMKNEPKMEPKWVQNRSKIQKKPEKRHAKIDAEIWSRKKCEKSQNQSTLVDPRCDLSCLRQCTRTGP